MIDAVGGLAKAVILAPGRGERCQITDDAVVSLRLDSRLRSATLDVGEPVDVTR